MFKDLFGGILSEKLDETDESNAHIFDLHVLSSWEQSRAKARKLGIIPEPSDSFEQAPLQKLMTSKDLNPEYITQLSWLRDVMNPRKDSRTALQKEKLDISSAYAGEAPMGAPKISVNPFEFWLVLQYFVGKLQEHIENFPSFQNLIIETFESNQPSPSGYIVNPLMTLRQHLFICNYDEKQYQVILKQIDQDAKNLLSEKSSKYKDLIDETLREMENEFQQYANNLHTEDLAPGMNKDMMISELTNTYISHLCELQEKNNIEFPETWMDDVQEIVTNKLNATLEDIKRSAFNAPHF